MNKTLVAALSASSLSALMTASPALAQSTGPGGAEVVLPNAAAPQPAPAQDEADNANTIVVTGTQIRGIAPVGSVVVGMSEQDIKATGATTTQQLIANLPQSSSFNNLTDTLPGRGVSAGVGRVPIARPNIRKLPACSGAGTGACTLILLDGHRMVPAGIEQIAVDPSVIPPGILQQVDALLDGASAIYGSDAIGGVLNFIPRKRYNGIKADARYGIGDKYYSFDANFTAGHEWGTGGVMISYAFGKNNSIYGRDRDYVQSLDWSKSPPTITSAGSTHQQCDAGPNVQVGTTIVNGTTLTGAPFICDPTDFATIYPANKRHTVYASLTQDFGDRFNFEVTGFYSDFHTTSNRGPMLGSVSISPANPSYRPVPGQSPTANETVLYSYGPVLGDFAGTQVVGIKNWEITPVLKADLGGGWQARALLTYGESETTYTGHDLDTAAQTAAVTAGTLNPFNLGATSAAILTDLSNFYNVSHGNNEFLNTRVTADGPLFNIPGGPVRAAVGFEYLKNDFHKATTNTLTQQLTPFTSASVAAWSLFGELAVPIVSADNASPGFHKVTLSASGRFDHYDHDVGGTFNPKFGLTYEPVDWLTLRGSWGKSFNAPTAADYVGQQLGGVAPVPCGTGSTCVFLGTLPLTPGIPHYVLAATGGTVQGLRPQTSTNWSLGFDFRPPMVDNLTLSLTYYNITTKDFISLPQLGSSVLQSFIDFPENLIITKPDGTPFTPAGLPPTDPYVQQLASRSPTGIAALGTIVPGGVVVAFVDNWVRNIGLFKVSGLDFSASYRHDIPHGSIDLRFSGNYQLRRDIAPHAGDPFSDSLLTDNVARFTSQTVLGVTLPRLRGQLTWNHTGPSRYKKDFFDLDDRVPAFDTIDLFFHYAIPATGFGKSLGLSLTLDNVFDADPPAYRSTNGANSGFAPNIRTLGRVAMFGIDVEF